MTTRGPHPQLNPEWLETFLAVAECGGVLAASRSMHISQPALSARLRRLEDTLGQALFERSAQGMSLTRAGHRLLPVARKLPSLLSEAMAAVDPGGRARPIGPLRLFVSTTLANFVLPSLLADYARTRDIPGLDVRVGNTEEVLGAVRGGRVALGAVEGLTRATGLLLEAFAQEEILPIYSPTRLSREIREKLEKCASARALAQLPLLWRESGSGTRRVVEEAFRRKGVSATALRADFVLGSTLALREGALAGLGVAFLPRRAVAQELASGLLCELTKPTLRIRRTFSWVRTPGAPLPPELEEFRRWVGSRIR